jgi:hypothetical protein
VGVKELEGKTAYSESRKINNSMVIFTLMIMAPLLKHLTSMCLLLDLQAIINNQMILYLIVMEW